MFQNCRVKTDEGTEGGAGSARTSVGRMALAPENWRHVHVSRVTYVFAGGVETVVAVGDIE